MKNSRMILRPILLIICTVCLLLLFPAPAIALTNLVTNGGFETTLPFLAEWAFTTGPGLSQPSVHAQSGKYHARIDIQGRHVHQAVDLPSHDVAITCRFEAYISTTPTGTGSIILESYDVLGNTMNTYQWDDTNSWPAYTAKWADITFDQLEKSVSITLILTQGIVGDFSDFDDISLTCPGGCFIATAAYGSYLDPHVETLRKFRDDYLLTNPVGEGLVSLYYKMSPPMATFIDEHPALKPVVRVALLPAVGVSEVAMNTTSCEKIATLALITVFSLALVVSLKRRHSRSKKKI